MAGHAASHVYFGLDPMWVSTVILAVTYAVIISEKINRSIVALVGAGLMIIVGVLTQDEAIKGVDFNTIGLLTGMMILVSISRRSGMFQYVAVWSAQAARAHPAGILLLLQVATAVLSAFLDNVTTVLLMVPVTIAITRELEVPVYPYLFAEIFASNIGGTATLIGDPPNILIGSLAGLDFNAFVIHLTPVIIVVMAVQALMIHLVWGRDLKATPEREARVMAMKPKETIHDWLLLKQSLVVLTIVMVAFVMARPLHLEPATIAMSGAAVLMLLDNRPVHGGAWRRGRRAARAPRQQAGRRHRRRHGDRGLRHPVGVGGPVGDCRQHPVRRDHDPPDQEHGPGLRRPGQDRAVVVVPVAGGVPGR
jgi:Na+/H+ antiporter NhaD/arsenite permease-like protein